MTVRNKNNPFAQSPGYWKVSFVVPQEAVAMAETAFDDITLAVSHFEANDAGTLWTFDLLFETVPDMTEVQQRLLVLSMLHGIDTPTTTMQEVVPQDWLAQVARNFPPLSIGRFYVHGSHVEEAPPQSSIAIQVEAGAAFGSGEHGTTRCCLEALEFLAKKYDFTNMLDMGCGSGILAIAAAKLWRSDVLAVDIDPIAVRVTQENVQINRVQAHVISAVSDGYESDRVKREAPYDLIIANILARPLIKFAPDLARNLKPNGVAVLSGLLNAQETQVLSAHRSQGLNLYKRFSYQEWCTLVLKR